MKRVSMKDIAIDVGCSIAAVSKVLNDSRGSTWVGEELRERIQRAAVELGYAANVSAQALRGNRALGVGVVVRASGEETRLTGGFSTALISGVEMEVRQRGLALTLIGEPTGPDSGQTALRYLAQGRVNALVGVPAESRDFIPPLDASKGAVVWAAAPGQQEQPNVVLDPEPGLAAGLQHLVENGHRSICLLGDLGENRVQDQALPDRLRYCQEWLAAAGVRSFSPEVTTGRASPWPDWWKNMLERGRQTILRVYQEKQPPVPTAVFALTEIVCQGALYGLLELGKRIPEDVSLMGFGNVRSQLFLPPLTSVSQELPLIGRRAAALTLERFEGRIFSPQYVEKIPSRLVVRESVGVAR